MQVEPAPTLPRRTPCVIERTFVSSRSVPDRQPIDDHELENLRRSLGASGGLPRDQVERLIVELHRLLAEHRQVVSLIENMHRSWPELRRALNDLDGIVRSRGPTPRR